MRLPLLKLNLPFICIGILFFSFIANPFFSVEVKSTFYSLSLLIKEILLFVLPLLVFSFVFNSIIQMQNRALAFLTTLLPLICLSNFISTTLSYFFGYTILGNQMEKINVNSTIESLIPLWQIHLPQPLSNDIVLGIGCLFGLAFSYISPILSKVIAKNLMDSTLFLLKKLLLPLMPLFIFGFSLKLAHDQILIVIFKQYLKIFLILTFIISLYISFIYGIAVKFKAHSWKQSLKNMAPAGIAGFSTTSSAAALPLMLIGAEKNNSCPEVARGVIPATVNVHLMGDCFAIPLFALTLLLSFDQGFPSYNVYLVFSLYFVLAKFAVAAVPGGGILVMLPILEKHLGFSPEMLSLITVLYITFDPVITSANVLGNGAFSMIFSRIFSKKRKKSL